MKIAALLLVLFVSAQSAGQEWYSRGRSWSQQIGGTRYTEYETDRGRITSMHQRIGSIEYGLYSDGGMSVTQKIGRTTYTDFLPPFEGYRRQHYRPRR